MRNLKLNSGGVCLKIAGYSLLVSFFGIVIDIIIGDPQLGLDIEDWIGKVISLGGSFIALVATIGEFFGTCGEGNQSIH